MSSPQILRRLLLMFCLAQSALGRPSEILGSAVSGSELTPAPPVPPAGEPTSPSALFRQLLNSSPEKRTLWLATRPPATRALVASKLDEFAALSTTERELRLEVAELEFFLAPLLRAAEPDRGPLLARIPPNLRPLIDQRIKAWDALSLDARKELLESQRLLAYFVRSERVDRQRLTETLQNVSPAVRASVESQFARWTALQPEERTRKTALFQRFFDLSASERDRTIRQLSEAERHQMNETLAQLAEMDAAQREQFVGAFRQFAALSPEERAEFMANADRWRSMKPEEQAAWRGLVRHLDLNSKSVPPAPPNVRPSNLASTNQ